MKNKQARLLANQWVSENKPDIDGFVGAYISGSVAWSSAGSSFNPGSDIDLFIVVDCKNIPVSPGKILWNDVILEINFVALNSISDSRKILSDYHLAGAFVADGLLDDPTGVIAKIRHEVQKDFANPTMIITRVKHAKSRASDFINQCNDQIEIHDKITFLFFGAGVCAHMILVSDLENPTIRRRYVEMKKSLTKHNRLDLHESLLASLGSKNWTQEVANCHLKNVATCFDIACSVIKSPYQFASDMTISSRSIAINGAEEMINSGHYRESAFWLIAIMARSRAVIAVDGNKTQLQMTDDLMDRLLIALGIVNDESIQGKIQEIEANILECWNFCTTVISSRA